MLCLDRENCIVSFFTTSRVISNTHSDGLRTEHEPKMWDNLKGQFMNHLQEVNETLRDAELPELDFTLWKLKWWSFEINNHVDDKKFKDGIYRKVIIVSSILAFDTTYPSWIFHGLYLIISCM